jgi:hypothetical protein
MASLNAEDQHVAVGEERQLFIPPVNVFAAYILKRENRQAGRKAICPLAKRLCFLAAGQRLGAVSARSCSLAFKNIFDEAFEGLTGGARFGNKARLEIGLDV